MNNSCFGDSLRCTSVACREVWRLMKLIRVNESRDDVVSDNGMEVISNIQVMTEGTVAKRCSGEIPSI